MKPSPLPSYAEESAYLITAAIPIKSSFLNANLVMYELVLMSSCSESDVPSAIKFSKTPKSMLRNTTEFYCLKASILIWNFNVIKDTHEDVKRHPWNLTNGAMSVSLFREYNVRK